jgi:uncharacterized protein YhbP (UPF0306 family)
MTDFSLIAVQAVNAAGRRVTLPRVARRRLSRIVHQMLRENVLCSIATVTPANHAHINTAYFAYSDGLELYFLSHPNSLHCRNLSKVPSVAATVMSSDQRWTAPGRGLQLFGRCIQARGRYADAAERVYGKRFSAYARWKASVEADSPGRDYRFYRLVVSALKILEERALGDGVFVRAGVRRTRR